MLKQFLTGAIGLGFLAACEAAGPTLPTGIQGAFEQAKSNEAELRAFVQDPRAEISIIICLALFMPKAGSDMLKKTACVSIKTR